MTDDKERNRVEDTLKDYGFRVQKSVFECRLTKSGLKNMVEEL
ncbi:MAG: CRISPR-associated endonuclease Cas2 [Deferribacterales bacterium]